MKIIELLNKIVNGEEVPKYIKYYDRLHQKEDTMMCCYNNIIYKLDNNIIDLIDEVEIIEEEKKIPEKLNIINGAVDGKWENGKSYNYTLSAPQTVIIHKLNEVIDYLKSKGE